MFFILSGTYVLFYVFNWVLNDDVRKRKKKKHKKPKKRY